MSSKEPDISKDEKKLQLLELNKRFLRFFIVSLGGLALNELIVFISLMILNQFIPSEVVFRLFQINIEKIIIATIFAIAIVMFYNYFLNKIWTFKEREEGKYFNTIAQFIKFSIVGGSGTIINLGVVYLLATVLGVNNYVSTTIAFILSVINNFIFNEIWTFNPKFAVDKEISNKK